MKTFMKHFLFLLVLLTGTCLASRAENYKLVPSDTDSSRMDTIVISTLADADADDELAELDDVVHFDFFDSADGGTALLVVLVLGICALPFFLVGIILWFGYKNRQARYRLAAEALSSGQSIPRELLKDPESQQQGMLVKGIKNISLGIGLAVMNWYLTESMGLASIGFLVVCMGVGEVIIALTTRPRRPRNDARSESDELSDGPSADEA